MDILLDDEDLHEDFNEKVVPMFSTEGDDLIEYEGDDGTVHLAESKVKIEAAGLDGVIRWTYVYLIGFQITEDDILSDFYDVKKDLIIDSWLWIGAYFVFLIIVFLLTFWLVKIVIANIVTPMDALVINLNYQTIDRDE